MVRIAIIDIGSNNIKLEIHDIDQNGHNQLICSDKIQARLASGLLLDNKLSEENVEIALDGLKNFKKLIDFHETIEIIAVGTAALREANIGNFLDRVKTECGFNVKIISGKKEAQLIYSGVLSNMQFNDRTFFLADIGGGSTEILICSQKGIHFAESLRIGTVKMKVLTEEKNSSENKVISKYLKREIKPFLTELLSEKIDMGIFTGGTARNILEILKHRENIEFENDRPILYSSSLKKLIKEIQKLSLKELKKLKGLDSSRADIILSGLVIMYSILRELKIEKLIISNKGLRDGILVDYIYKNINKKIYTQIKKKYRYNSLEKFSQKYNLQKKHGEHCAFLASRLFDELQTNHKLDESYKILLYAASLLHDCGIFIDYSQHHKHTQYLIMNTELLGFSKKEKILIALIARYHRKGFPKGSHLEFQSLDENKKEIILKMASLLRIADALDRSYNCCVKDINVVSNKTEIILEITTDADLSLELWSLKRKKDYFEKIFKKKLRYKII